MRSACRVAVCIMLGVLGAFSGFAVAGGSLNTTSTSAASEVIPSSPYSVYIWTTTYIGPQTIRIGQQTGCVATIPLPPTGCTPSGGAGTPTNPFLYGCMVPLSGCSGGSLLSIVAGGQDIDTFVFSVTPFAPPTIVKSFGAASILLDGSTSLSFTISNPNATTSLTGGGVTDTLQPGLISSTPNGLTGSCGGGTITATAGSGSVSLSGATLAASASCTFSVKVTGTTSGAKDNVTGAVTSVEGGTGLTTSATVTVASPPTIAKHFAPTTVVLNGSTSLTFTISNPNPSTALTGVGFTDALEAGLIVSTPNGLTGNCGGGTIAAAAGSGVISLTGATLAGNASCTFGVNVTFTTVGAKNNTTGAVTSVEGGTGGTASAGLGAINTFTTSTSSQILPGGTPSVYAWTNDYIGPQTIQVGQQSGCVLTVAQPVPNCTLSSGTGTPTDPFLYVCTGIPPLAGCAGGSFMSLVPGAQDFDTHVHSVRPFAPPTIAKSFGAASIPLNGSTSLSFTISNPNASSSLTGVGVTDTLPAGLVVSTPNGLIGSCGGGTIAATAGSGSVNLTGATLAADASCTYSVKVTGTTLGTKDNVSGAVTSVEGGAGLTASASVAVMALGTDANLSALTVSSGSLSPAFAPGTLAYTDSVLNCVASITVTPTLEDPAASVKVNGATVASGTHSAPISLAVGVNPIDAVVTAQDGTTMQTYMLAVTRDAPGANAPMLQSAVSRKVHGAAGTFDLPLSLVLTAPTTEPRRGPVQTIVLTFDKAIDGATASIDEGIATAATPTFSGNDVIVGLTGASDQQYVTVGLTSVASTDGGSGGCGVVRLGLLVGDVNQNRVVSLADLGLVNVQLAQFVTSANFLKDVNASGTLTVADKGITNANLTRSLPAP